MDYSRIYIELMERSFERELGGYVEKHHIIPKCMGGDDKERNLAVLTPEEHYVAHQLLVKIYPKNYKLVYAAQLMTTGKDKQRINNKLYGWVRRRLSDANRGENHHNFGKKTSKEVLEKISDSLKGKNAGQKHYMFGKSPNAETRKKLSLSMKGKRVGSKHPMWGKTLKDCPNAKKISQFSISGDFIRDWDCITQVTQELGIDNSSIGKCCRGQKKTAGGFIWKYKI